MYKCQNCQTTVPANTKSHRITIESRAKQYPRRERAMKIKQDGKVLHIPDKGGEGWEIVREIIVCPECAEKLGSN